MLLNKDINMEVGDYVLASVDCAECNPRNPWAVGFLTAQWYTKAGHLRFLVSDAEGQLIYPYNRGFESAFKISQARGAWIMKHRKYIEDSGRKLNYFLRCPMKD